VLRRGAEDETRGRERRAGGAGIRLSGFNGGRRGGSVRARAALHGPRLASPPV